MPQPEACGRCVRRPPEIEAAAAAFEYRFPVDRVVQRFKFGGDLAAGRWLGLQLAHAVGMAPRPDLLVAPPLAAARLRERGFNQALELAKVVAAERGVRLDPWVVERVRATAPQPGLGGRARRENLRGAFACRGALDGAHVAIVDDVMTTGATADAMARALRDAGASRIDAWVVARTP
jgi:ComF family protein